MNNPIENQIVLVTGANRGIGRAIVETLLRKGAAKIYAAVRKLESAGPLVEADGDKVVPVQFDLADPASIQAAAATASDVTIVVNNAGILTTTATLDGAAAESLEAELRVNTFGLLHVSQAFAPVLKANGGGALVQLNSVVSLKAFPNVATYSASKAASYALTQSLRAELAEQGTRVVSVHPGPIATDMIQQAGEELAAIAEPASLVADGIAAALENGDFHVFPDSMARQIGEAYASFAADVVLADSGA